MRLVALVLALGLGLRYVAEAGVGCARRAARIARERFWIYVRRMWKVVCTIAIVGAGCGQRTAAPETPAPREPGTETPEEREPELDREVAMEAAARPEVGLPSSAVLAAPEWVFRYRTAERTELWSLRVAGDEAYLMVETARGTSPYLGTAAEGESLVIDVRSPGATIGLECKRTARPMGKACNAAKAPPVEILDCYHRDFATPMPFAAAPGIEYVVDATCNGYRLARP